MSAAPSLVARRAVVFVIASTFAGFSCLYLLLPTVPLIAEQSSGRLGAGLATGAFMTATVACQALMPSILRRKGAHGVFVLGLALIGVPGLCYSFSSHIAVILVVTAVRGAGFGIIAVVGAALCAVFADPERRGRALGIYGFFTAGAGIVYPPLGVALFDSGQRGVLFVVASAVAAGGAVLAWLRLPRQALAVPETGSVQAALRDRGVLASLLSFFPAAMFFGAVYSFLVLLHPHTGSGALLAFGIAMTSGRLVAGARVDRVPFALLVIPGVVMTLVGSLAIGVLADGMAVVVAAAAAGAGCGVLGTATLADVMHRRGPDEFASSSTAWNLCFDGGAAIGSIGFAVVASTAGLKPVFIGAAVCVAVCGLCAQWVAHGASRRRVVSPPAPPRP